MTHSTLAIRLEAAIATKGLSRRELGRLSGVHANTLNNWVSGESTRPQPTQLRRVAQALGVSYEWLRTGEGPMLPPLEPLSFNEKLARDTQALSSRPPGPLGFENSLLKVVQQAPSYTAPSLDIALLQQALQAALKVAPKETPERLAEVIAQAYDTALRTRRLDKVEELVRMLLS